MSAEKFVCKTCEQRGEPPEFADKFAFLYATGDAALLMVLAASASYIAVPAVLRYAMPEATPSLYFGLSLGVTFPLNILFGIPLYVGVARAVLG